MNPRIIFIGGTPRGLKLMDMLIKGGENVISAFIMKEDHHESVKVSGDLRKLCKRHGIASVICRKLKNRNIHQVLGLRPDIAFVCGWRTLLPSSLYNNIPFGCIAAHDSLLPKYRGFAPLNWSIINGERFTGVTLFKIADGGVDSGDVYAQKKVRIGKNETAASVYPRTIDATIELYAQFLRALKSKKVKWHKQDEKSATYMPRRTPDDGEIRWRDPSKNIFNLIRALSPPYPCAWTYYNGKKIYIESAKMSKAPLSIGKGDPGKIAAFSKDGISIFCGEGQIIINEIKNLSGKTVKAKDILLSKAKMLGR